MVRFTHGGFSFVGKVTCLAVKDHVALAAGRIVKSSNPFIVGFGFTQLIAAPDRASTHLFFVPPASCHVPLFFVSNKATSGHFKVHAAEDEEDDDD